MSNTEQIEFWNGEAGQRWADSDAMMERILAPVTEALLAHARLSGQTRALDVGCGGGSQSVRLAQELGGDASVLGVDVSAPMLKIAQQKAQSHEQGRARLEFMEADASACDFEPDSFDLLFSRFGVMFFDDPQAAFSNLGKALRPQARLAFCCWQKPQENKWAWQPLQAALKYLPPPEKQDPHAPGPFAFADPARLQSILGGSGFCDVEIVSHAVQMQFGQSTNLEGALADLVNIGPVARMLEGQTDDVKARVQADLEQEMAIYFEDGTLKIPGAVWFVTARRDQAF
jgi:SAM-dependent methyltransferase